MGIHTARAGAACTSLRRIITITASTVIFVTSATTVAVAAGL